MSRGDAIGRDHARHGMHRRIVCVAAFAAVFAASVRPARALSATEQRAVAEAFAPVLAFHADEHFFPVSPWYGLEMCGDSPCLDRPNLAVPRVSPPADERIRAYEASPLAARLASAVVYFRIIEQDPWLERGQVRLEYWLYYAANRYRMHGGVIPFTADGNHAHDLEHVFLVLEARVPEARGPDQFALREVWAGAHGGSSIPSNAYRWPGLGGAPNRLSLLVELGSHAMAPDVNGDGRFVPADDSTGDRTFVWGVRDRGQSWAWFKPRYTEPRTSPDAVRLCPAAAVADGGCRDCGPSCAPYRLDRAETLDVRSPALGALIEEAREIYARKHWASRLFGEVDGRTLLSPALHPEGRDAREMTNRPARAERGVAVGFTPVLSPATFFVSGRYATALPGAHSPKTIVNVTTLVLPGRAIGEVDGSLWYPIDPITKVLLGVQGRTDLFSGDRTRRSVHAGVEFRIGRWRWRVLARHGALQSSVEFKLYYFVWQ